ncbi:hypothetical protein FACS189413_15900 [Bacteroidia bacterium]|nr:hypothetical protein FACS189413_15900 [Bacteroidia bacterium]
MEMHPHFQQPELFDFVNKNGMVAIGYCPIGLPNRPERDKTADDTVPIEDPAIVSNSKSTRYSSCRCLHQWAVQNGQIPIPFSVKPEKFMSNMGRSLEIIV